ECVYFRLYIRRLHTCCYRDWSSDVCSSDLLISKGRDLTKLPLSERRELLAVLKLRLPRIRISEQFNISAADMVSAVRQQRLEGVVAKRKSSVYEEGKRSGSWAKMRINQAQ